MLYESSLYVSDVTFIGNAALTDTGVLKAQFNCIVYTKDCSFSENKALRGHGGGIYAMENTSVTLLNVTMFRNYAYMVGGALLFSYDSSLLLSNSYIYENYAQADVGVIHIQSNYLFIAINSTFESNTAYQHGGCVLVEDGGEICLDNCVLKGCRALEGGGIASRLSKIKLSNVIFTNNTATEGHDIYYQTDEGAKVELYTLKTLFQHETFVLASNHTNFVQEALDKNVLDSINDWVDLRINESPYASGKVYLLWLN